MQQANNERTRAIEAAVIDVGDDLALVVEQDGPARDIVAVACSAYASCCDIVWHLRDGATERLDLSAIPLAVQRRLWCILASDGVPVFEVTAAGPSYTAVAVLYTDRVEHP